MTPDVSILMPMRNAAAFVAESVRSVLAERSLALELIVIDDGSTDGSAEAVRGVADERVRIEPGPQRGIAPALNAALQLSRGRYLHRCDSDDLIEPGYLAAQVAWLESHPEFAAVCGTYRMVDAHGRDLRRFHEGAVGAEITEELRRGVTRTHLGTWVLRGDVLRGLGGARDYFSGVEDIDIQLRVGTAGRVWFEPRCGYVYRLHGTSSTHTQPTPQREFLTDVARQFALQRAAGEPDDLERGRPPVVPSGGKAQRVDQHVQGMLVGRAWRQWRAGERKAALGSAWEAVRARPLASEGWRALLGVALKPAPRGAAS